MPTCHERVLKAVRADRYHVVAAGALLLAGPACAGNGDIIDPELFAIVFGRATNETGGPVPGVTVVVRAYNAGCHGAVMTSGSAVSNNARLYRVKLPGGGPCGIINVTPPAGSDLAPATIRDVNLPFRIPPDSVRVDIQLTSS
jgi:hypothetical protein